MPNTRELDPHAPATLLDGDDLPRIDVGPLFGDDASARAKVVEQIRCACQAPGFFSVHNTCVSDELLAEALAHATTFFSLPDASDIKQRVDNRLTPGGVGWGPMFEEPAYQPGTVAHMESFDMSPPVEWVGTPEEARKLGIWVNVWPELPGFQATIERLYIAARELSSALFEVFAELLGMPRTYFASRATRRAPSTMRLLHYPGSAVASARSNVGIAAHTDFECFTTMWQTAPGLEVTDISGRWLQAPARPGEFIIILGDMLERLSNGTFKATGHRVGILPWRRYAMILFNALDGDCEVAPLPTFISETRPAAYAPITQQAHIAAEVAHAHALRTDAEEAGEVSDPKAGATREP